MLKDFNYSYLVYLAPTAHRKARAVQVNCWEIVMEPSGGVTFWSKDRKHIACAFPAGSWTEIEVMSQLHGGGNGYETLKEYD